MLRASLRVRAAACSQADLVLPQNAARPDAEQARSII